jgi:hypothetical protein
MAAPGKNMDTKRGMLLVTRMLTANPSAVGDPIAFSSENFRPKYEHRAHSHGEEICEHAACDPLLCAVDNVKVTRFDCSGA